MSDSALKVVYRTLARLAVWAFPIVVGIVVALGVTGHFHLRWGAGSKADPGNVVLEAEQPFRAEYLFYSRDLMKVVKQAERDGRDILTAFDRMESAWKEVSPTKALAVKFVTAPLTEPITGKSVLQIFRPTVVVYKDNFDELRPILQELRMLILEGDGSGKGRLPRCGYHAEPAELNELIEQLDRPTMKAVKRESPY
jgi:hypothetical protein